MNSSTNRNLSTTQLIPKIIDIDRIYFILTNHKVQALILINKTYVFINYLKIIIITNTHTFQDY